MGGRNRALEPERLFRSQRLDLDKNARPTVGVPADFWWSALDWSVKTPDNDPSAFVKLVFGSDSDLSGIESVANQYRALFDACDVPERTRKMIMGGTLTKLLGLPES
jgi:hypothetical protein